MATVSDFRPAALASGRDLETFVSASSPIPINLLTVTALRTRLMNLARVADTSVPGSGVGDATWAASDGRALASPGFRMSS